VDRAPGVAERELRSGGREKQGEDGSEEHYIQFATLFRIPGK
jgi:hypothetical protein